MKNRISTFYIQAVNIHQGGGKTLLNVLLKNLPPDYKIVLFCDQRMQLPKELPSAVQVRKYKPTITQRLCAELNLYKITKKDDLVLCFGSLPPLFRLKSKTIVFIQNRYLVEKKCLNNFSIKTRIRLNIERIWLKLNLSHADSFIVQTSTMRQRLAALISPTKPKQIIIKPYIENPISYQRDFKAKEPVPTKKFDFIYVASGEPHKNHRNLILAWCELASHGFRPTLALTLNSASNVELLEFINEQIKKLDLNITNCDSLTSEDIHKLYTDANALIFPSTLESFGLPLIEARQHGLHVLASELDYVRDILDPEESFDPNSSTSIARAVSRFKKYPYPEHRIINGTEFINSILNTAGDY